MILSKYRRLKLIMAGRQILSFGILRKSQHCKILIVKSNRPSKRTERLFQRIKDTNKRYIPVKQKVVSESQHILTLANGSVLRKSEVAGKAPKPPTMSAAKRRADLKRAQEEQAAGTSARKTIEAGTRSKSQNWDYEDEADSDSEYKPLRISRCAGQNMDEPTAKNNTEGVAGTSGGSDAQASKGVDSEIQTTGTGQGESAPNLNSEAQPGKLSKKKVERVRRQRLVSYSSQDSQDSDGAVIQLLLFSEIYGIEICVFHRVTFLFISGNLKDDSSRIR